MLCAWLQDCRLVWPSAFLLGIAVFAPLEAFMLCVDYYDHVFPGAQAAVKISATYDALLTVTQLLCYCSEHWIRKWSRQRIVVRHALVAGLLGLMVVYDRVIIANADPPPSYALGILLAIAALIGALDGVSVGAVYGDVGVTGPGPTQAMIAGHAMAFLALVILRAITKKALPATAEGMRVSVCIYFGVTALLVLLALVAYLLVIRPAAVAATSDRMGPKLAKQLDVLPFGATVSVRSGLRYTPMRSARGTSLSVHLVHSGLPPKALHSITGSIMISPSLLQGRLPQFSTTPADSAAAAPTAPAAGAAHPKRAAVAAAGRGDHQDQDQPRSQPLPTVAENYSSDTKLLATSQSAPPTSLLPGPNANGGEAVAAPRKARRRSSSGAAGEEEEPDALATVVELEGAGESTLADLQSPFSVPHLQPKFMHLFSSRSAKYNAHGHVDTLHSRGPSSAGGHHPSGRHSGAHSGSTHSHGVTRGELKALQSGQLHLDEVLQLSHKPPQPKYALPGRSVALVTVAILKEYWAHCLGIMLSYFISFTLFPAILGFVRWEAVGDWYPLLLQITMGFADTGGKLLPVWEPSRPKTAILSISTARGLTIPAFVLGLYYAAPPAFYFVMTFVLSVTAWYETMVFAMACDEGLHPDDVYMVESTLAFMIQAGSLSGALLSLSLSAGPWAVGMKGHHGL